MQFGVSRKNLMSNLACMQRWQVMLQLKEAEVMAAIGDLHQACSMCQQALDFSITAGLSLQPHTITAQVMSIIYNAVVCRPDILLNLYKPH